MPGNSTKSQAALQTLRIADFTSGIVSQSYYSRSARVPNNSQKITASENTYGVMGLPGGGLICAPVIASAPTSTITFPTHFTFPVITGIVQGRPETSTGWFNNAIVVTGLNSSTANLATLLLESTSAGHTNTIYTNGDVGNSASSSSYLSFPCSSIMDTTGTTLEEAIMWAVNGASISATFYPWVSDGGSRSGNLGVGNIGFLISANGRIWQISPLASWLGGNQIWASINYTNPSAGTAPNVTINVENTLIDYDSPMSFGGWGVVSSSEMLIVKAGMGGIIISGDIFNPTISRAPAVQGTNGMMGVASQTPMGLVYVSSGAGVWAWSGGGASQKISPQVDDSFFDVGATAGNVSFTSLMGGSSNSYNCQYINNMLFVSGGKFYDPNTSAWWQLPTYMNTADTNGYQPFFYSPQSNATAGLGVSCPWFQNASGTTTFNETLYSWDVLNVITPPTGKFNSFWESNPIFLSNNQDIVEVQEIDVVMSGQGTLSLKVLGVGGGTASFRTVTINSTQLKRYRLPVEFQTDVVVLQVGFTYGTPGQTAIIESICLDYRTTFPIATS